GTILAAGKLSARWDGGASRLNWRGNIPFPNFLKLIKVFCPDQKRQFATSPKSQKSSLRPGQTQLSPHHANRKTGIRRAHVSCRFVPLRQRVARKRPGIPNVNFGESEST